MYFQVLVGKLLCAPHPQFVVCICMYVYMYVCRPYVCMYVCMHALCMYVCMYAGPMYVCMYVCMPYVCMYVCILSRWIYYIHVWTFRFVYLPLGLLLIWYVIRRYQTKYTNTSALYVKLTETRLNPLRTAYWFRSLCIRMRGYEVRETCNISNFDIRVEGWIKF